MKQYSIKTCYIENALGVLKKLGMQNKTWQINHISGDREFKLLFRTDMEYGEIASRLKDFFPDELPTLTRDF